MAQNRFRSQVKKTTITVPTHVFVDDPANPGKQKQIEGEPLFDYQSRFQGQASILQTVTAHPGLDLVIEDVVELFTEIPELKKMLAKKDKQGDFLEKVKEKLEQSGYSVPEVASKLIRKVPGLVSELLAAGVELQENETAEDFKEFIDTLTLLQVYAMMRQWYQFNLASGIGPLVAGLMAGQGETAKADEDVAEEVPAPKPVLRPARLRA